MSTGGRNDRHLSMVVGEVRQLRLSKGLMKDYQLIGLRSDRPTVLTVASVGCAGGGSIAILRAITDGTSTVRVELSPRGNKSPGPPGIDWFAQIRVRHQ